MNPARQRAAGTALKLAAQRFVGQEATPAVCVRIKKAFIQIMREQFSIDWSKDAWQIQVWFADGATPNVKIPPSLLNV